MAVVATRKKYEFSRLRVSLRHGGGKVFRDGSAAGAPGEDTKDLETISRELLDCASMRRNRIPPAGTA